MNLGIPGVTRERTCLLIVILLFITLWILYPHEFVESDQWMYSRSAFGIAHDFDFGSTIFDHRFAVTLPVAVIYYLFGVSIYTTNLWPLCASLMVLIIIWISLPDVKGKIIGAFLCITSIPLFRSSIELLPDIIGTTFMALSSYILFNRWKLKNRTGRYWPLVPILAVSLLFTAFLAKESAYWVFPLWILALFHDLKERVDTKMLKQFYLTAFSTGVLIVLIYFLFNYRLYEDPLARFKVIQSLTGQHSWSWEKKSIQNLILRLTVNPFLFILNQYGILTILFAIIGAFIAQPSIKGWVYYISLCLLFFWFGSTSFAHYEPMPLVERMTLPILPALIILNAFSLSRVFNNFTRRKELYSYLSLTLVLIFVGVSFLHFVTSWWGKELPKTIAISIVKRDVMNSSNKDYLLICSNRRSADALNFYFGYQCPKNLQIIFIGNLTDVSLNNKSFYIYIDKKCSKLLKRLYHDRIFDDEIESLNIPTIYRKADILLYKIQEKAALTKLISDTKPKETPLH